MSWADLPSTPGVIVATSSRQLVRHQRVAPLLLKSAEVPLYYGRQLACARLWEKAALGAIGGAGTVCKVRRRSEDD